MVKNLVGQAWAIAAQFNLEVIPEKIQLPRDSQTTDSCWELAEGQESHCPQTGTHLALAVAPRWSPARLADLPEAEAVSFQPKESQGQVRKANFISSLPLPARKRLLLVLKGSALLNSD